MALQSSFQRRRPPGTLTLHFHIQRSRFLVWNRRGCGLNVMNVSKSMLSIQSREARGNLERNGK
jgi:hypothetical protein